MQKEINFIPNFGRAENDSMEILSNFFVLDVQGLILGSKGINISTSIPWGSIFSALRIDPSRFLSRKYAKTHLLLIGKHQNTPNTA